MKDDDTGVLRPVLIGLGALLGVTLLIGGIISAVALGVADMAGVSGDDSTGQANSGETSLYMPSPSTSDEPAEPEGSEAVEEPAEPETTKPAPAERPITLEASPTSVSASERINLTGAYGDSRGATLQVQRYTGGWVDFPVTVTVQNDTFATWVESGQTGQARFRVLDKANGQSSKPVLVDIG